MIKKTVQVGFIVGSRVKCGLR